MKMRYGEEDIIMKSISEFIRLQRLRWAGHVVRMPDNRLPKRVLNSRMQARRHAKLDRCQNDSVGGGR